MMQRNYFDDRPRKTVRCKVCGNTSRWYEKNPKSGRCHTCLTYIDVNGNPVQDPADKAVSWMALIGVAFLILTIAYLILGMFVFNSFSWVIFAIGMIISVALLGFVAFLEGII